MAGSGIPARRRLDEEAVFLLLPDDNRDTAGVRGPDFGIDCGVNEAFEPPESGVRDLWPEDGV